MKSHQLKNRRKAKNNPLAAAVATALGVYATLPVSVYAQSEDGQLSVEEVIVTASRRSTTVQDIPFNITAVTGAALEEQRLDNLAEFSRWVPGLSQVDQGGRGSDLLTVRGLNVSSLAASEFLGNGSGGTVATYIGDIPLYLDFKLNDIDRVETLLGPQGTLYGAGTLGGAIRYIPNRPDLDETSAEFNVDLFGLAHSDSLGQDVGFVFNTPLIENKLALRASISYFDDPGFIDYDFLVREAGVSDPEPNFNDPADVAANLTSRKDANTEQTLSGRLSLLWQISDAVDVTMTYFYQDQEAGARTINHTGAFGTDQYVSAHRFLEPNDRTNQLLSFEVVADLGFAELTSATGFSNYEEIGQRDQTDLLLNFEYGYEDFPSFAAFTREIAEEDRINQEIRLVSNPTGNFSWIAGLFYNRLETDATSEEFTPGIPGFFGIERPDNLEFFQLTEQEITEKAVFGEVSYQFTDKWQVTAGARWFDFDNRTDVGFDLPILDTLTGAQGPNEIVFDTQSNSVSDNDVIFKLNTSYDYSDDVKFFATISEGYRLGGVNSVPECAVPLDPTQNVCALANEILISPDTTTNFELGVHSTLLDGRVTLNGSVYFIDWEDIQVAGETVNGAVPITVNGGTAESKGLELSASALINENWAIRGVYSYTDAQLTSDAPGLVDGNDAFDGDRLAGTPEHQASVFLAYQRGLSNGWDFDAGYSISAISDVYTKVGLRNTGEALGGFALHNASASVSSGNWSVTLYADNLLDKFAETSVRDELSAIRNVGEFRLRRYFKNVTRPRQVGVQFRYSF